jgi:hypothetical protein
MDTLVEKQAGQRSYWVTRLLLIAVAFLGLAHLAFLPPWEGFDEPAHWSSVEQIADTGTLPLYGKARLSADIEDYPGPLPYGFSLPENGAKRQTYRTYREAASPDIPTPPERKYEPGTVLNWQAQHPPLFYGLMAPVYKLVAHLPWVDHLLYLRLASWLIAFCGLVVGVLATERLLPSIGGRLASLMAAYPLMFPQFFPEMARLGNDSLVLLFCGASWAALLCILYGKPGVKAPILLGVFLGLGLLTKAFFLPISAGFLLFLAYYWWNNKVDFPLRHLLLALGVTLLIGGAWYVRNALLFGSVVGGDEFVAMERGPGFIAGLHANFSIGALLRGFASMAATFSWAGTWSLARLPDLLLLGPLALLGLAVVGGLLDIRRRPIIAWAPLFIVTPMLAGLGYHVFMKVAQTGLGKGTPGWYLHVLAAPLGMIVALGWRWPRLMSALFSYSLIFAAGAWVMQLTLFSGCSAKLDGNPYYTFKESSCFIDWHQLDVLASPMVGFASLLAGVVALGVAGIVHFRGRAASGGIPS